MNAFVSAVDTIYDAVVRVSVTVVEKGINTYSRGTTVTHKKNERAEVQDIEEATESTFRTVHDILKEKVHTQADADKNTVMYVSGFNVPLYRNPTIEFDGQIATIPYGEMVMMREARGRFFRATWNKEEGWILREDVVDRAAHVYPEFKIGEENHADSPNTAHVRAILGDTFGLSRSSFPLQAGEYVLYRLWRKGVHPSWPGTRPRVPGLWHALLKGTQGVHVGVVPKSGSVIEYMMNNEAGHVAYVEAVFPDDTITISEANYPDFGIYNERELTMAEWKELKPVFITAR
jgi:hypothetical protein